MLSGPRLLAVIVVLMVGAAVVYGLVMVGSPGRARRLQFDQRRLDSLRQISYGIQGFVQENGRLPRDLTELSGRNVSPEALQDPETGQAVEYRATGSDKYEVCAVFAFSSAEAAASDKRYSYPEPVTVPMVKPGAPMAAIDPFAQPHQAGRFCYGVSVQIPQKPPLPAVTEPPAQSNQMGQPNQPANSSQPATSPAADCHLKVDPTTKNVGCFGCANGQCRFAPAGWEDYQSRPGSIGIEYACYSDKSGCRLAQ